MKLSAMKALRSLSFHTNPRYLQTPFRTSSLTLRPTSAAISRQFRATACSLESPKPKVWTVYNPLTGRTQTRKPAKNDPPESQTSPPEPKTSSSEEDRTYGSSKRNLKDFSVREFMGNNKKKGKTKTFWVCSSCGYSDGQWWGICRSCESSGTMSEVVGEVTSGDSKPFRVSEKKPGPWVPKEDRVLPVRLRDVKRGVCDQEWRISLPGTLGAEIDTVLGGGIAPGSLVLIGGDPGVGKSTLLLQIAALVSGGSETGSASPVLYVSGEESIEQIGNRADRLEIDTDELFLYSGTDVEDIIQKAQLISPRVLIIDSIQTVYLNNVTGTAGGLIQVKECTMALLRFSKKTGVPVLLIGHVTKSGEIAGPRVLEHIVDVVLYMEGEKRSSHRLLRSVKNRFGSTDELGVFEMSQTGLLAVANSSGIFLSEESSGSEILAGLAVAVTMDGSRTFLLEIQALCVSGSVSRQVNGIQMSRADMIISVLVKQAGLKIQQNAIFLNVVSGIALTETAGDLAIAAAICSSYLEYPIPNNFAFIGEIGLGGELRSVPRMDKRIHTVAKLGYKKCIVPKSAEISVAMPATEGMKIVGCRNLKEVINAVFSDKMSP